MTALLSIFANNLLPVFLAAGSGYLLSKFFNINPRSLSQVIFYIFSPCLVFTLLTKSELSNGPIIRVMFFVIVLITIIGLFTWLFGKAIRLERRLLAGMIVTTIFMNAGNFGLPVVVFAFGEDALGYASIFFVTMAILAYTIGVVIASLGSVTLAQSLLNLLKIPTLYAFIVAISLMYTGFKLPVVLDRTISLLGEAAIPSMLVLLGLQLKSVSWSIKKGPMTFAIVMRLLVSPLVAFLFAPVFGLAGPALQASVLLAAMPTAVFAIVLATEYNAEPSFATAAVTTTLLLSPLTLTPILSILGT